MSTSVRSQIGVCSWSLTPKGPAELSGHLRRIRDAHGGMELGVQLALEPLRAGHWNEIETVNMLRDAGVAIVSGMMEMQGEDYSTLESIRRTGGVRPNQTWPINHAEAVQVARIARRLAIGLVTFHAGFIPHDDNDPERAVMLSRLRELADIFDDHGVRIAFETGQETAETLLHALAELDRPHVGVNFDPANMILYGMRGAAGKIDPCDALELLAHRVAQVHIKDAKATHQPETWGSEVPAGAGEVDWARFFEVLRAKRMGVDLIIERESGADRAGDIGSAIKLIRRLRG